MLKCIKSAKGDNITNAIGIATRWREYCEELYNNQDMNNEIEEQLKTRTPEKEPPPLRSGVDSAVQNSKS